LRRHGVLKSSTLKEMHRPHWLAEDWTWGNGLGFALRRYNGERVVFELDSAGRIQRLKVAGEYFVRAEGKGVDS
jgi:hypothetical protein